MTYDTVIDFENPQERLLPGETAYVTIPTGQAENTLEIPNAALSFTPSLSAEDLQKIYRNHGIPPAAHTSHAGGQQVMWKLVGGRDLEPVAVKAGISDYAFTQVVDGTLAEGDLRPR